LLGIDLVERSVAAAPGNPHAWNNLGNMRMVEGHTEAARDAYRRATSLADGLTQAWYNLGILSRRLRDYEAAVLHFEKALLTGPAFSRAYEALGMTLYRLQRYEDADRLYRRWLEREPDNAIARHMSAAMTGEGAERRASDEYVKVLFDRFAEQFDDNLAALSYRAPQLLISALGDFADTQSARLDILDAGCGTGLCGPLLRSSARKLDGVDLSEAMIGKARERRVYDALSVGELCAFMRGCGAAYDAVVSADTLCYFGDLLEPLEAARACLRTQGLIAFTVEALADVDAQKKYLLQPHGRYVHGARYLDDAVRAGGFRMLSLESVVLRQERDADVAGYLCVARCAPAAI
jgi:predicted TPR repeat methyltransferase